VQVAYSVDAAGVEVLAEFRQALEIQAATFGQTLCKNSVSQWRRSLLRSLPITSGWAMRSMRRRCDHTYEYADDEVFVRRAPIIHSGVGGNRHGGINGKMPGVSQIKIGVASWSE